MNCVACGSYGRSIATEMWEVGRGVDAQDVLATYYVCRVCGLVSKEPRPSSKELREHYSGSWQHATSRPPICFSSAAEWIVSILKPRHMGLAIDVGSKGDSLQRAMEDIGAWLQWEYVDPKPTNASVAPGWAGDGITPTHAYSFVSATHVLEHVSDPRQFLLDILGMLHHGGVAYIEVPSLELHAEDAGSCDDMNRDHLWHFTAHSLYALASSVGASVIACELGRIPAWPVHRLLLQEGRETVRGSTALIRDSKDLIMYEYELAAQTLEAADRSSSCLYAASHSAAILLRDFASATDGLPIYDLYKAGKKIHGRPIFHPRDMPPEIKVAYVTTRFWNAYKDIATWISKNLPGVEPRSPFKSMALL